MTVSKDYNKHVYEGNGLTVDWPYDFDLPLTSSGDPDTSLIHVFRTNLRGEVTEVTAFSVDAETGTLTYPSSGSPLETGEKLTILRLLDVRQQFFDPSNQANLYPETLEDNTDRLVMMLQQLQEEIDRAVGTNGANGKTILGGAVDPTTEGVDGDWYINRISGHIWEKVSGTWTDRGSIKWADQGVPTGGTTGQILAKSSSTDYATEWVDAPSGSGGVSLGLVIALS